MKKHEKYLHNGLVLVLIHSNGIVCESDQSYPDANKPAIPIPNENIAKRFTHC
jgi:hypothetical protein